MEEITAAEWLQAWGSIVGAALGAGLAIAGAVWIQHRTDRRRARAYASTLYAIIERIRACIRRLLVAIDENQHTSTKEAMLRELVRHGDVLQRFIPFAELDDFDQAEFLVEICNQVEDLKRPIANLDDQRAQSAQARGPRRTRPTSASCRRTGRTSVRPRGTWTSTADRRSTDCSTSGCAPILGWGPG